MRKFIIAFLGIALASTFALAQSQSAPTLRIVTEDPTLPSDLFYGNLRVKPVRLRPGTNVRITIDDTDFFIQQHYIDFLNRFPEPNGWLAWQRTLDNCAPGDSRCDRIEVSSAFFRSDEFLLKGYTV